MHAMHRQWAFIILVFTQYLLATHGTIVKDATLDHIALQTSRKSNTFNSNVTEFQTNDVIFIEDKPKKAIEIVQKLKNIDNVNIKIHSPYGVTSMDEFLNLNPKTTFRMVQNNQTLNLFDIARLLDLNQINFIRPTNLNIDGVSITLSDVIDIYARDLQPSISIRYANNGEYLFYENEQIGATQLYNIIFQRPNFVYDFSSMEINGIKLPFQSMMYTLKYIPNLMVIFEKQKMTVTDFLKTHPNFKGKLQLELEGVIDVLVDVFKKALKYTIVDYITMSKAMVSPYYVFESIKHIREIEAWRPGPGNHPKPLTLFLNDVFPDEDPKQNIIQVFYKGILITVQNLIELLLTEGHTVFGDMSYVERLSRDKSYSVRFKDHIYSIEAFLDTYGRTSEYYEILDGDKVLSLKEIEPLVNSNQRNSISLLQPDMNIVSMFSVSFRMPELVYNLALQKPRHVMISYNGKTYLPDQFIQLFRDKIPEDFTIQQNGVDVPSSDIFRILDINTTPQFLKTYNVLNVEYKGQVYTKDDVLLAILEKPEHFTIMENGQFRNPISFKEHYIDNVPEYVVYYKDKPIKPEEIANLVDLEAILEEEFYPILYNSNTYSPQEVVTMLYNQQPDKTKILHKEKAYTPEEYLESFPSTKFQILYNDYPIKAQDLEQIIDFDLKFPKSKLQFFTINYKGVSYSKEDILDILIEQSPPNVKILHKGVFYLPAQFKRLFGNNIPTNFAVVQNRRIIPSKLIPTIVRLGNSKQADPKVFPNIFYGGKEYTPDDILQLIITQNPPDVMIGLRNRNFTPKQFEKMYDGVYPITFSILFKNIVITPEEIVNIVDFERYETTEPPKVIIYTTNRGQKWLPTTTERTTENMDEEDEVPYVTRIVEEDDISAMKKRTKPLFYKSTESRADSTETSMDVSKWGESQETPSNTTHKEPTTLKGLEPEDLSINVKDIGPSKDFDKSNQFPYVVHDGTLFSPTDVVKSLVEMISNKVLINKWKILYQGLEYIPIDFLQKFKTIPRNFKIYKGDEEIVPERVANMIPLKNYGFVVTEEDENGNPFPHLVINGVIYTPQHILHCLINQGGNETYIIHQGRVYQPETFKEEFNSKPLPDFDVVVKNETIPKENLSRVVDLQQQPFLTTARPPTLMTTVMTPELVTQSTPESVSGIEFVTQPETTFEHESIATTTELPIKFPYIVHNGSIFSPYEVVKTIRDQSPENVTINFDDQVFTPETFYEYYIRDTPDNFNIYQNDVYIPPQDVPTIVNFDVSNYGGYDYDYDNEKDSIPVTSRIKPAKPTVNTEIIKQILRDNPNTRVVINNREYEPNEIRPNLKINQNDIKIIEDETRSVYISRDSTTTPKDYILRPDYRPALVKLSNLPDSDQVTIRQNDKVYPLNKFLQIFQNRIPENITVVDQNVEIPIKEIDRLLEQKMSTTPQIYTPIKTKQPDNTVFSSEGEDIKLPKDQPEDKLADKPQGFDLPEVPDGRVVIIDEPGENPKQTVVVRGDSPYFGETNNVNLNLPQTTTFSHQELVTLNPIDQTETPSPDSSVPETPPSGIQSTKENDEFPGLETTPGTRMTSEDDDFPPKYSSTTPKTDKTRKIDDFYPIDYSTTPLSILTKTNTENPVESIEEFETSTIPTTTSVVDNNSFELNSDEINSLNNQTPTPRYPGGVTTTQKSFDVEPREPKTSDFLSEFGDINSPDDDTGSIDFDQFTNEPNFGSDKPVKDVRIVNYGPKNSEVPTESDVFVKEVKPTRPPMFPGHPQIIGIRSTETPVRIMEYEPETGRSTTPSRILDQPIMPEVSYVEVTHPTVTISKIDESTVHPKIVNNMPRQPEFEHIPKYPDNIGSEETELPFSGKPTESSRTTRLDLKPEQPKQPKTFVEINKPQLPSREVVNTIFKPKYPTIVEREETEPPFSIEVTSGKPIRPVGVPQMPKQQILYPEMGTTPKLHAKPTFAPEHPKMFVDDGTEPSISIEEIPFKPKQLEYPKQPVFHQVEVTTPEMPTKPMFKPEYPSIQEGDRPELFSSTEEIPNMLKPKIPKQPTFYPELVTKPDIPTKPTFRIKEMPQLPKQPKFDQEIITKTTMSTKPKIEPDYPSMEEGDRPDLPFSIEEIPQQPIQQIEYPLHPKQKTIYPELITEPTMPTKQPFRPKYPSMEEGEKPKSPFSIKEIPTIRQEMYTQPTMPTKPSFPEYPSIEENNRPGSPFSIEDIPGTPQRPQQPTMPTKPSLKPEYPSIEESERTESPFSIEEIPGKPQRTQQPTMPTNPSFRPEYPSIEEGKIPDSPFSIEEISGKPQKHKQPTISPGIFAEPTMPTKSSFRPQYPSKEKGEKHESPFSIEEIPGKSQRPQQPTMPTKPAFRQEYPSVEDGERQDLPFSIEELSGKPRKPEQPTISPGIFKEPTMPLKPSFRPENPSIEESENPDLPFSIEKIPSKPGRTQQPTIRLEKPTIPTKPSFRPEYPLLERSERPKSPFSIEEIPGKPGTPQQPTIRPETFTKPTIPTKPSFRLEYPSIERSERPESPFSIEEIPGKPRTPQQPTIRPETFTKPTIPTKPSFRLEYPSIERSERPESPFSIEEIQGKPGRPQQPTIRPETFTKPTIPTKPSFRLEYPSIERSERPESPFSIEEIQGKPGRPQQPTIRPETFTKPTIPTKPSFRLEYPSIERSERPESPFSIEEIQGKPGRPQQPTIRIETFTKPTIPTKPSFRLAYPSIERSERPESPFSIEEIPGLPGRPQQPTIRPETFTKLTIPTKPLFRPEYPSIEAGDRPNFPLSIKDLPRKPERPQQPTMRPGMFTNPTMPTKLSFRPKYSSQGEGERPEFPFSVEEMPGKHERPQQPKMYTDMFTQPTMPTKPLFREYPSIDENKRPGLPFSIGDIPGKPQRPQQPTMPTKHIFKPDYPSIEESERPESPISIEEIPGKPRRPQQPTTHPGMFTKPSMPTKPSFSLEYPSIEEGDRPESPFSIEEIPGKPQWHDLPTIYPEMFTKPTMPTKPSFRPEYPFVVEEVNKPEEVPSKPIQPTYMTQFDNSLELPGKPTTDMPGLRELTEYPERSQSVEITDITQPKIKLPEPTASINQHPGNKPTTDTPELQPQPTSNNYPQVKPESPPHPNNHNLIIRGNEVLDETDIVKHLAVSNPKNITVIYDNIPYSPEEFIKLYPESTPDLDIEYAINNTRVPPYIVASYIPTEPKVHPNTTFPDVIKDGVIYKPIDILREIAKDPEGQCVQVVYDGQLYTPREFYNLFKDKPEFPNNFQMQVSNKIIDPKLFLSIFKVLDKEGVVKAADLNRNNRSIPGLRELNKISLKAYQEPIEPSTTKPSVVLTYIYKVLNKEPNFDIIYKGQLYKPMEYINKYGNNAPGKFKIIYHGNLMTPKAFYKFLKTRLQTPNSEPHRIVDYGSGPTEFPSISFEGEEYTPSLVLQALAVSNPNNVTVKYMGRLYNPMQVIASYGMSPRSFELVDSKGNVINPQEPWKYLKTNYENGRKAMTVESKKFPTIVYDGEKYTPREVLKNIYYQRFNAAVKLIDGQLVSAAQALRMNPFPEEFDLVTSSGKINPPTQIARMITLKKYRN